MSIKIFTLASFAVASAMGAALPAGPALADGPIKRGSIKDTVAAPAPRICTLSANVALATEYVFRGVSQTAEGPAIQGGFDATCGIFYAGVWASNLDWGSVGGNDVANIEIDWYAGIKPKTGRITWDLGVIYYSYPSSIDFTGFDNNYLEIKVGGSAEIWKDGTLGVAVFFSPDYQYETGNVWTVETGFSQILPKVGMFTPTVSALLGYQTGKDASYAARVGNLDDHYFYWNAGLTLGFLEKWSLDLRYWDSSLGGNAGGSGFCKGATFQCDERFMATLKFTY
ncbi:MAG: TorF family putative porin [Hyphomonadaceae bacterium]|nr:TorF family putative porin [Hyphomonadaceae bacterium]